MRQSQRGLHSAIATAKNHDLATEIEMGFAKITFDVGEVFSGDTEFVGEIGPAGRKNDRSAVIFSRDPLSLRANAEGCFEGCSKECFCGEPANIGHGFKGVNREVELSSDSQQISQILLSRGLRLIRRYERDASDRDPLVTAEPPRRWSPPGHRLPDDSLLENDELEAGCPKRNSHFQADRPPPNDNRVEACWSERRGLACGHAGYPAEQRKRMKNGER